MDGVLVIDKPIGPTSHDVVARVRRVLRERRVGHTGTLDPLASGVLPLVVGRATRLASLLSSSEKEYEAAVRLGASTSTYDAAPRLAAGEGPPPAPVLTLEEVEGTLEHYRGVFHQAPPPFSAKKVGGVPAYKLARRDQPTALAPVQVGVRELVALGLDDGLLRLRVAASAGFYVRSLAHDLGARLGCGGYLESLRRTRAGTFSLVDASTLEAIEADPALGRLRLLPLSGLGMDLPAVTLTPDGARRASHGNPLGPADLASPAPAELHEGAQVRLLSEPGSLIAVAAVGADGLLRPRIVLV